MPDSMPLSLGQALARLREALGADGQRAAEALLLGVLGLPRSLLFSHPERGVDGADAARLWSALERVLGGEPLAYVLWQQGFW